MKKAGIGIAVILALLVCLTAFAPARVLIPLLDPDRKVIQSADGSIWSGRLQTTYQGEPLSQITWDVQVFDLFRGRLAAIYSCSGSGFKLEGEVFRSWSEGGLDVKGHLDSHAINRVLSFYDIDVSNTLEIQPTHIRFSHELEVLHAEGKLTWEGGPVLYSLASTTHRTNLPPLQGELSAQQSGIRLEISELKSEDAVMTLLFNLTSGEMEFSATNRLMVLADAPWISPGEANARAFTVYERTYDALAL